MNCDTKPGSNIKELKDNTKKTVEIKLWNIKSMEVMSRKKKDYEYTAKINWKILPLAEYNTRSRK